MKAWKIFALAIVLCFAGAGILYAGDVGELDTTFGDGGKVVTSFDVFGDQAYAVAIQSDGKILAAGSTFNGYDLDIAIARYSTDGSLDTSFGNDGKLRSSLNSGDEEITAIAVQDDGKIVAGGYTVIDGSREFALVRFTSAGEFDNSFGKGGVVITGFGNLDDEITALTIDDEGRIVVCGYVTGTAGLIVALARYDEDGNLNATFGVAGSALTDIGDDALARSIDIDEEGRLVVTGSFFHANRIEMMVLRYSADGVLDTGFGQDGIALPADQLINSEGYGVGVTEDGMIMVAGTVGSPGSLDSALFRFTEIGQPDLTFGDNGVLVTSPSDEDDMALSIDVLGNIVGLSGFSTFNTKRDFLFATIEDEKDSGTNVAVNDEKDGFVGNERQFANVFDVRGQKVELPEEGTQVKSVFTTTYFGYTDDVSYAVALQSDGKAISVGYTEKNGVSSFAIARYITPVASDVSAAAELATVGWIMTKEPSNVESTSAFTGGTILDTGKKITQRGVVFSIAPDPVYEAAESSTTATTTATTTTTATNAIESNANTLAGSTVTKRTSSAPAATAYSASQSQSVTPAEAPQVKEETEESGLLVSKGSPSGEIAAGSTMTYIGVYTNEQAVCRFSRQAGQDFDYIPDEMATADNLAHIARVNGLYDGNTYTYYIRCRDIEGDENSEDYVLSFKVASASDYSEPYNRYTRTLGNFFVATAYAQDAVDGGTTNTSSSSVFDMSAPSYTEGGYTDNGSGIGSYSSILRDLKPGTFYYVRAYAIDSNGKVYYGNQVGFQTPDSCFIATAAYGTLLHPYVKVLRSFRDRYMLTNVLGRDLVKFYYTHSPPVADYIAARPVVRGIVRVALLPIIGTSWLIINMGVTGMILLAVCVILPFTLIFRSYRRLEVY